MYNDGIWYATLSKNLANGIGTFWYPKLTETIFPIFHEHPPLVFGIQSLFFSVLGEHIFIERFYAFTVFLLSAALIVSIWKLIFKSTPQLGKLWYIPLSLWLLNEVVYHYYPSNILEGTLGVFTLATTYLLLKVVNTALSRNDIIIIVLAGLSLFCATLSKGVVGLFPLALFGLHWIVFRSFSFFQVLVRTFILTATLAICYTALLSLEPALDGLGKYFDSQFLASLNEERTTYHHRENRLHIIRRLLEILIPTFLLTGGIFFLSKRKSKQKLVSSKERKLLIFFVLIGLSASFPIILSPKQAVYYLLPSLPYFAIGFSIIVSPIVHKWITLRGALNKHRVIAGVTLILLCASIGFTITNIGKISKRDQQVLNDVCEIGKIVPPRSIIASRAYSAHLVGYFYRLSEISLDTSSYDRPYLIVEKKDSNIVDHAVYDNLGLNTLRYDLYQQKEQ